MMLAVYAVVNGNTTGWTSAPTVSLLGLAVILFILFLFIESRVARPLVPLALFRIRNVATANVIAILWAAAMFAWFFLSALYMQLILGYSPLKVGLAFLPSNLIMAAFSLGLSAKIVMRWGYRMPVVLGMFIVALGLLLFARAPLDGTFLMHVLPPMLLLGLGAGIAFNPVLLSAMSDVSAEDSGLASGVVNTAFMMGGALGLAILASLAAAQMMSQAAMGVSQLAAINSGYHVAFLGGAVLAGLAAVIAGFFLSAKPPASHPTQAGMH